MGGKATTREMGEAIAAAVSQASPKAPRAGKPDVAVTPR
jgi:hypothetical protein